MVAISKKEQSILFHLLNNEVITCKALSGLCNQSEKTIRNSIQRINKTLQVPIILSNNRGYSLNQAYSHLVDNLTVDNNSFDHNHLLHHFIFHSPCSFDDICDTFFLSSSALQHRIKLLNEELSNFNLKIVRKNNFLHFTGDAQHRRTLLVHLIRKETAASFDEIETLQIYFPHHDISKIIQAIDSSLQSSHYFIPTNYKINLYIHLLSSLDINLISTNTSSIHFDDPSLYDLSKSIADKIGLNKEHFIAQIYTSLLGIVRQNTPSNSLSSPFTKKIKDIVYRVFTAYLIDVNLDEFINFLSSHIYHLIERYQNNNYITPSFLDIKQHNFYVYDVAVSICKEISQEFNISISDSDISLIAIHIGFSIEKYFQEFQSFDTGCIYLYIKNKRIEEELILYIKTHSEQLTFSIITDPTEVLSISSQHLLITTEPLPSFTHVQICHLTPFFNQNDKSSVLKAILNFSERQHQQFFFQLAKTHFDEQLFFVNPELCEKKDCLHFLNDILLNKKIISNNFLPSVLKRESLSSTAFMDQFAIPHAMEAIAHQSKIAVLINPNGISWDQQTIQIVFLIAIKKEDQKNLKILYDHITKSLCNPQKNLQLSTCRSLDKLIDFLI